MPCGSQEYQSIKARKRDKAAQLEAEGMCGRDCSHHRELQSRDWNHIVKPSRDLLPISSIQNPLLKFPQHSKIAQAAEEQTVQTGVLGLSLSFSPASIFLTMNTLFI